METGNLTHSHSQPGGIDRTPPGTPRKGGKMLAVRVLMLDDTVTIFQVQAKALGRVLFEQVCNQLHLLESDYFGLEYEEAGGTKYWLDLEKPLSRQIGLSLVDTLVRFCVKFYTPDPSQLEEEFTRYLFCLQIKRDLSQGLLQCNNNTAALLASYIVQAECGDYVAEDYPDHRYLSSFKFVPNQDQELERKIMENHKKHAGQSPAEADLNLLETARRCELYGIKMHPAKNHEGAPLNLAVAHMGIVIFQNFTKINTFSWAKIRKISFKRKRFLVKLHPEGYGHYKDIVEFFFEGRNECKNFWKKCVENHGFFRCTMVKKVPRQKTRVLSRGSSFRYSGRTQKQIVDFVRENYVKRQTFQRSQSFRHSSSAHSSVANVGTSISAHPLLPLGDNAVAGTPASLSCGSMTLTSSPLHTADIHAEGSPSPPLTTSVSPGTSVTSSPQHFYPQETPYRRAGHQPTRMRIFHGLTRHVISPLQSPTDAATPASNRSANLSNNNLVIDGSDITSSRVSLKSPDYANFNDVYSHCYSSWRTPRNDVDNKINDGETKTDTYNLPNDFLNKASKSNESIRSMSKNSKQLIEKEAEDSERYTWHKSASCKDLYRDEDVTDDKNEKSIPKTLKSPYEMDFGVSAVRYDNSRRKCYSAATSKNPSMERTGDVISDMKIYSSSYPGTTSSLSTESAEGEPDDRVMEMIDVKYDSQEDMVLSHDDVSHDSYELLERELNIYDDELIGIKSKRAVSDNERARSCSWGSNKGMSPFDSRSTENVVTSGYGMLEDINFWSLDRERSPKHKSETDFRSLNYATATGYRTANGREEGRVNFDNCDERRKMGRNFLQEEIKYVKRLKEAQDEHFVMSNRELSYGNPIFSSKNYVEKDLYRTYDQELRPPNLKHDDTYKSVDSKKYPDRRKSLEELLVFPFDSDEGMTGKHIRLEERRKMDRKRDRRDREEKFHEGIKEKEQKEWEWERERERRQMGRKKNVEDVAKWKEEEVRKMLPRPANYDNFQETRFKNFNRVVPTQYDNYPDYLSEESANDFFTQERKVMENYEKICQVGRIAKELKENESALKNWECQKLLNKKTQEDICPEMEKMKQTNEIEQHDKIKGNVCVGIPSDSPKLNHKLGKALVERTKSDPYNCPKNQKRYILMHQKSVDLSSQQLDETASDYDNDDILKKTSKSEHDIPYILHKRHCMNGTARNSDILLSKTDFKSSLEAKLSTKEIKSDNLATESKKSEEISKKSSLEGYKYPRHKPTSPHAKAPDLIKTPGVQIINLDLNTETNHVNVIDSKAVPKAKKSVAKKPLATETKISTSKIITKREVKKVELPKPVKTVPEKLKKDVEVHKNSKLPDSIEKTEEKSVEPIYAEVSKEKCVSDEPFLSEKIPPEPPKRTSSISSKENLEKKSIIEKKENICKAKTPLHKPIEEEEVPKILPKPTKRITPIPKTTAIKTGEKEPEDRVLKPDTIAVVNTQTESKPESSLKKESDRKEEPHKVQPSVIRGKQELPFTGSVLKRREESLILFARTRLGLSEGSAFTPIVRQGHVGSPASQRRAKSLDAPYVSVHSLPPVDSFSSKDDTMDENDGYVVKSAVARAKELFKVDLKKPQLETSPKEHSSMETTISTESCMDSAFHDDIEVDSNFKKTVESQSKVEIPFPEEKVLDNVRSKRLLSKIESVDVIDSEGDLDSSKMADPPPIPSDRLVNLPESIRFPSVRQISGQTSEESVDGWEQKEVKVKRRTPRRSVGREETGNDIKESVVWDSKDDEPPDDEVWDDNLVFTGKYEGSVVTDAVVPVEYLKRGSCGQSIDDDNLSTPMKESSPEHWVSVDDLPEALEREEKLLRQQEKILREKILNEKIKRELNLDTIDVDERYCEFRDNFNQQKYEDGSLGNKDKFKGHSLDTYELNEKKLREKGTVKNSSLDEHLLGEKHIRNYDISALTVDENSSYENVIKATNYQGEVDYIHCKVVKNVKEIDQLEDLDEFLVVVKNKDKDFEDIIWDEDDLFKRTVSKEESLISVPEEFKDVEKEPDEVIPEDKTDKISTGNVEIRLSEDEGKGKRLTGEEHILASSLLQEKLDLVASEKEVKNSEDAKLGPTGDVGRLSPYGESRRGSEEHRKLSTSEDTGRLSPYDCSSRRSSDDPRRLSGSEDPGRLSPFNDSRRGSEDPRRLSTSEDSRKYSMSESVSEETRRRLSSTEETRRKRASLTKQCSVGADSLSDEMISGIQECSSSFEHDEKDVFEAEPVVVKPKEPSAVEIKKIEAQPDEEPINNSKEKAEVPQVRQLEIEISEDIENVKENVETTVNEEENIEENGISHLAPPTSERELSRETEDSMDYGEGDFKDIRDVVKEKDISEGLICEHEVVIVDNENSKAPSLFDKSESSEGDELRFIDEKRANTPDIIMGKRKEDISMSVVVVNEGLSVLNKMSTSTEWLGEASKTHSLPREAAFTDNDKEMFLESQRHTLPKKLTKPKPLTPKPVDYVHIKLMKAAQNIKADFVAPDKLSKESLNILKSSLDSSQESDIDKLGDISLISQVQHQIARRNLSDTGKGLSRNEFDGYGFENYERKTSSEEDALVLGHQTSSEERERTESSSFELRSSADELGAAEDGKLKASKEERKFSVKSNFEKKKRESALVVGKEKKSPDQEKRDSGEDGSSSSSAPPYPKKELSSTWKPFLLESSGSSSLEEGWLPPDDNAHLADEEETSSTSNNQQDDSYHDEFDYPTGIGYPVLSVSNAEMLVGGYSSAYVLSRTLSRISERSTSEQERSDMDDDITKPSSHSVSAEEESLMSSDHQPSLSSDPPSPREITSGIPDLPDDQHVEEFKVPGDSTPVCEPFGDIIPPPLHDDDWPSPPSSSSVIDTPVVSHVETFYMEIHPEEACKVVVMEPQNDGNSSSDENHTLHEESEFLHLSSDNISASTTTTTQDGTVIVPVRPRSVRTGSVSEDTSLISTSEWSNSTMIKPRQVYRTNEELSEWMKTSHDFENTACFRHSNDDVSDWSGSMNQSQPYYVKYEEGIESRTERQIGIETGQKEPSDRLVPSSSKYYSDGHTEPEIQKSKISTKIKPVKLVSPPTKNIGFFETPVSKVRSPTSQSRFFEVGDKNSGGYSGMRGHSSFSERTSPKHYERFFEGGQVPLTPDVCDHRKPKSPTKAKHSSREYSSVCQSVCTPYYSNVADSAEKSYFGRYDTGSLERTRIHSSRKCRSYYSVSKAVPHDNESDGSNSEEPPPPPSSNTIPRASKKTRRRHRVAMDLVIRDGKIVAPPKTRTTVIDNSDSDRSSPRDFITSDVRSKQVDV